MVTRLRFFAFPESYLAVSKKKITQMFSSHHEKWRLRHCLPYVSWSKPYRMGDWCESTHTSAREQTRAQTHTHMHTSRSIPPFLPFYLSLRFLFLSLLRFYFPPSTPAPSLRLCPSMSPSQSTDYKYICISIQKEEERERERESEHTDTHTHTWLLVYAVLM